MNKLLCVNVKGKSGEQYGFHFYGDPKYIPEWESDGIDVWQVENVIPAWASNSGLGRAYMFIQDFINLKFMGIFRKNKTELIGQTEFYKKDKP